MKLINNLFPLKTILKILIYTSIANIAIAFPAEANQSDRDHFIHSSNNAEIILSQNISTQDNPTYPEPSDNTKTIVGLTGLAIGIGFIGWQVTKANNPSGTGSLLNFNRQSNNTGSLLERVSPRLRKELLRSVHNRATAVRLLNGTLTSNPGRSPDWLAEKVIYDLKRGR